MLRSRYRNQPAEVLRAVSPGVGHLVGVAKQAGVIHVELGDLARVVSQWEETPMMAPAALPYINGRRFVAVPVARRWAQDLMSKDRKAQALQLIKVLDWAENILRDGGRDAA